VQESSGAYNPQVEAISPTLPNDEARDVIKQSKEELLQNINRADREIGIAEQNLKKLQAKQVNDVFVGSRNRLPINIQTQPKQGLDIQCHLKIHLFPSFHIYLQLTSAAEARLNLFYLFMWHLS